MSDTNPDVEHEAAAPPERPHRRRRLFRNRKRGLPFDLNKALFILPNAFTASSIACGLYAILQATVEGGGTFEFYQAALAIFFAGFFDMFDGRVARLTRTQSDFGVQFDSLADVVSFGVAPAVLVFKWGLQDLGMLGGLTAFTYLACGAIRLARFNVLTARGLGSSTHFIGLPIPLAAAMLVSLVIAHHKALGVPVRAHGSVVALTLVLSYLMISNVRYQSFKSFRPKLKHAPVFALGLLAAVAITLAFRFSVTLVVALGAYIFAGLLSEVLFFKQRREAERAKAADTAASREVGRPAGQHVT